MCVEIVFFLVTYVCYNFMAAEILPKQRREIIVRGDGNYRVIALWRVETSDSLKHGEISPGQSNENANSG